MINKRIMKSIIKETYSLLKNALTGLLIEIIQRRNVHICPRLSVLICAQKYMWQFFVSVFQGQTDIAQHCAFTPGGALVASGAAGLTLALT